MSRTVCAPGRTVCVARGVTEGEDRKLDVAHVMHTVESMTTWIQAKPPYLPPRLRVPETWTTVIWLALAIAVLVASVAGSGFWLAGKPFWH
ncbi:MAG TPA: hypothetical protein VGC79_10140 [Polyangiaceae bacterium]